MKKLFLLTIFISNFSWALDALPDSFLLTDIPTDYANGKFFIGDFSLVFTKKLPIIKEGNKETGGIFMSENNCKLTAYRGSEGKVINRLDGYAIQNVYFEGLDESREGASLVQLTLYNVYHIPRMLYLTCNFGQPVKFSQFTVGLMKKKLKKMVEFYE